VIATSTIRPEIKFDGAFLSMLVAILGTTISPYLFFWQTEQEVEEKITSGKRRLWQRRGASARLLKDRAIDVGCGMLLCSVVMYFIILSTGATLFQSGQHNITTAAEAAQALRPIAGPGATALFALGIVGSGLLAIPILTTSAAYTLCQTFGWRHGLSERFENAKAFYGAIILFTVLGASLNCFGINPIQALLWAAIINGVVAPPLLILITMIANNKKIMGTHTNGPLNNAFCFLAIGVMSAAAIAMFVLFKTDPTTEAMILQTLPKTAMSTNSHF
jgi:Mn2+/Fe2+ NRAMP family transporter